VAGALVTSTGSGLSVPDWPLSYGKFFPPMVGGIFYEHGHRMIAGFVAMLTVTLALLIQKSETRLWVKVLGWFSVALVFFQALLGGLTVLLLLPAFVSIFHAVIAQTFFCTLVCICMVTSCYWSEPLSLPIYSSDHLKKTANFSIFLTICFFIQLILGANVRHKNAGLSIPDFPTVYGGVLPPAWTYEIAVHYLHRLGAFFITFMVFYLSYRVITQHSKQIELVKSLFILLLLILTQWVLGASIIWFMRPIWVTSFHLVCGAACLATSVVINLQLIKHQAHSFDLLSGFPKSLTTAK
jgi:cytochrome c oxidase assembly protein subunit 15